MHGSCQLLVSCWIEVGAWIILIIVQLQLVPRPRVSKRCPSVKGVLLPPPTDGRGESEISGEPPLHLRKERPHAAAFPTYARVAPPADGAAPMHDANDAQGAARSSWRCVKSTPQRPR